MSHLRILESELPKFQIELPQVQKVALATYCDETARWNKKINLTGLSGVDLVRRLVAEPVWIAGQLHLRGTLLDIGSGNGSPALPFLIVSEVTAAHLVEARTKRAAFLRHVTQLLELPATVHRARLEDLTIAQVQPDWISLQGVALNDNLLAEIRRFVQPTTQIVWITSADVKTDVFPARTLTVPLTRTRALVFQLDLS